MNLVLTLEEHTEQLYHAFEYLNKYHDFELVLDPSDQVIYQADFECQYWTSSKSGNVSGKEDITPNMPAPCVLDFVVTERVDADHSEYTVIWLSRIGFLIYGKRAPVYWMSKKHTICESSPFGGEFVSIKFVLNSFVGSDKNYTRWGLWSMDMTKMLEMTNMFFSTVQLRIIYWLPSCKGRRGKRWMDDSICEYTRQSRRSLEKGASYEWEAMGICFVCYIITYVGLFQRQLRLHSVGMLVGIKQYTMNTYAWRCRLWNMLLFVWGYGFYPVEPQ